MKHALILIVAALVASPPVARGIGSEEAAVAFAVATPTSYDGSATFTNRRPDGKVVNYSYDFSLDAKFGITRLVVNGVAVAVPYGQTLRVLPYPKTGTVENLQLSVDGFDDLASAGRQAAGHGSSYWYWVDKGQQLLVFLDPALIKVWLPADDLPAGKDTSGWQLWFEGGSASALTTVNGQRGFWLWINPHAWSYGYQIISPTGDLFGWGQIDPANVQPLVTSGQAVAVSQSDGVEIVDLRQQPMGWKVLAGVIDGQLGIEPGHYGYFGAGGFGGDAVAVRCNQWYTLQVRYAGPSAWLLVKELDENGQQTRDYQGNLREWRVASDQLGGQNAYPAANIPLATGRAVILVYPSEGTQPYGQPYQLFAEEIGGRG